VAEVAEVTEVAEAMALEESGKAEGAAAAMAVSVEAAMESMVVEEWWATVAAMAPAMVVTDAVTAQEETREAGVVATSSQPALRELRDASPAPWHQSP